MKKDFPIFANNPGLIFFDSTSTSQKPKYVIDGITNYLENSYSNIHRGMYDIAITSESLYKQSKQKVCDVIAGNSWKEVIYTFNSTYASNLLASSIKKSNLLKKGDKILVSIVEHHANIVPWLILKEEIGIELEYVWVDDNFCIDLKDFEDKYDEKVKIISLTQVSNVVGEINPLEEIGKLKRDDTLFIVDGSQSVPHMKVNMQELNCDAFFFTGHKIFADSGIGILWGKQKFLEWLTPSFSGGGSINEVCMGSFSSAWLPDKFEPGTPNVTGAVSLLKAFEYIDQIGWYEYIERKEEELCGYFLSKLEKYPQIQLIGNTKSKKRVGVFSFFIPGHHSDDIAEYLAENGIAVRSWKHCAHPLFESLKIAHSVRVSFHIYNEISEIDTLFDLLAKLD